MWYQEGLTHLLHKVKTHPCFWHTPGLPLPSGFLVGQFIHWFESLYRTLHLRASVLGLVDACLHRPKCAGTYTPCAEKWHNVTEQFLEPRGTATKTTRALAVRRQVSSVFTVFPAPWDAAHQLRSGAQQYLVQGRVTRYQWTKNATKIPPTTVMVIMGGRQEGK